MHPGQFLNGTVYVEYAGKGVPGMLRMLCACDVPGDLSMLRSMLVWVWVMPLSMVAGMLRASYIGYAGYTG